MIFFLAFSSTDEIEILYLTSEPQVLRKKALLKYKGLPRVLGYKGTWLIIIGEKRNKDKMSQGTREHEQF